MRRNSERTLADVELDLDDALQRKTGGMLKIGQLLNEAKELVPHGEWLSWLRRYTALTHRSAQRYMKAAAWAATVTNDTVSFLGLRCLSPRAIYALASGKYDDDVVALIISAAAADQRLLNEADVSEIARRGSRAAILKEIDADQKAEVEAEAEAEAADELRRKAYRAEEDAQHAAYVAKRAEADAEVEAILNGGVDPNLPPTPTPAIVASADTFHVASFEKAIDLLRSVMTKPVATFASAKISANDVEQITAFLHDVARQIAGKRPPPVEAANPDQQPSAVWLAAAARQQARNAAMK